MLGLVPEKLKKKIKKKKRNKVCKYFSLYDCFTPVSNRPVTRGIRKPLFTESFYYFCNGAVLFVFISMFFGIFHKNLHLHPPHCETVSNHGSFLVLMHIRISVTLNWFDFYFYIQKQSGDGLVSFFIYKCPQDPKVLNLITLRISS